MSKTETKGRKSTKKKPSYYTIEALDRQKFEYVIQ